MAALIRVARAADLERLERIENEADRLLVERFSPASWLPAGTGAARAAVPGFVLVAAEQRDGEAIGFVHVVEAEGHAHLEQLSVLPEHGRRGHGRALVEAATAEAARRGHRELTLRTYADVPWNAPFYATLGFVESAPATPFHLALEAQERRLGLAEHGRRIQMTAPLLA